MELSESLSLPPTSSSPSPLPSSSPSPLTTTSTTTLPVSPTKSKKRKSKKTHSDAPPAGDDAEGGGEDTHVAKRHSKQQQQQQQRQKKTKRSSRGHEESEDESDGGATSLDSLSVVSLSPATTQIKLSVTSSSSPAPMLADTGFRSASMLLSPEQVEQAKRDQEEIARLMPAKEILLRFENVDKFVEVVEERPFRKNKVTLKQILFGVSGCVRPGEIVALMGPSGSGKTTLLNILGGRTTLRVSGEVTLNGEPMVKAMKRRIAYVMQQDIFFEHLTVREQLTFTALLRFPRQMTSQQKRAQVDSTIAALGIAKCADSPIWLISGGERKRVNIGTELLTNPTLLLLDEPTSGLDSTTSVQLMRTLRLLALRGKTIVTSIHQPASQVFQSFDKLLLLADGKMIYSGPPAQVVPYFARLGYRSPPDYNPADFIMDLVNADDNPREFLQQKFLELGIQSLDMPPKITPDLGKDSIAHQASIWPTSYLGQLAVLMHRNAKNSKAKLFTVLNFSQSILLALVAGLCWFRLGLTDSSIADREGFIFFVMTFWPFQTLFSGLLSFPSEREVIMKERASGSYHLSTYILSKAVSDAPMVLLLPALFLIVSYWMANMNSNFAHFLGFMFSELVCVWAAESIGLFLGATFLDMQKALVTATVSMLTLMLVGGFFVHNLPVFVYWARYLSIFTYAFNACLIMEFPSDRVFECGVHPSVPMCATQATVSGDEILDFIGVTGVDRNYGFNVGMLLLFLIGFRLLAYLSLRFLNTKHFRQ